jgi:uncharacterized protein YidB (DUF937 family)
MEEQVGLLDVVNGVLAGPRGQMQPQQPQARSTSGGMSPLTMAVLALLAYKAFKGSGTDGQTAPNADSRTGTGGLGGLLGGLGGLFGGGGGSQGGFADLAGRLGGLFGGAAAGSTLSSGLSNLINDLNGAGVRQAQSWVGSGPNQSVAPEQLGAALGDDAVDALSRQTGMSRSDLLSALSRHLPEVVDHLTPHGRLPTEGEAQQLAQAA